MVESAKEQFYILLEKQISGSGGSGKSVWYQSKISEVINILKNEVKTDKKYYYYAKKYMIQIVGEEISLCLKNSEPRR